ncbi:MAG: multicopper oxidase family protein, partial [Candidatus Dadabacteria bacterium]
MHQLYLLRRHLALFSFLLLVTFPVSAQDELLDPHTQPQFVNELPVPPVISALSGGTFTISVSQFDQWLGLVNPSNGQHLSTKVWGYNGHYPGPTILAKKNTPVDVFWRNELVNSSGEPLPHLLPVDPTLHWAYNMDPSQGGVGLEMLNQYGVPLVTHLHGGHTEAASDGLPDMWFSPRFTRKGEGFIKGDVEPFHYANSQEAATLWYHDHAMGITRLNVYAGLAGFYLLTDNNEISLRQAGILPPAQYELGLAIQDRMFKPDGSLFYPSAPPLPGEPSPSVLPEFFGDFILVNGMTWPVLQVEPRQYRFRMLNGSDSRFYNLFLSSGQSFIQIGSDDGLLMQPVNLQQVLMGPGERKDIILDFSDPKLWGQTIILHNNAKTPFPKGEPVDPQTTGRIMAFKVNVPLNSSFAATHVTGP